MNSILVFALAALGWVWNALDSPRAASLLCIIVLLGLGEVNSRVTDLQERYAAAEDQRDHAEESEHFHDDEL